MKCEDTSAVIQEGLRGIDPERVTKVTDLADDLARPEALEALFARAEKEVREGLLPSAQIAGAREGRIAGMRSVGHVTHGDRSAEATNDAKTRTSISSHAGKFLAATERLCFGGAAQYGKCAC